MAAGSRVVLQSDHSVVSAAWLRRRPPSAKNLEALGAARLAELLMEISASNAAAKRRLRLELAGAQSPREVAKEIRKRLTAIARS
jgi:hypothetical protein